MQPLPVLFSRVLHVLRFLRNEWMVTGLFLVNFSTEPVGLSPPNFTEPDGKTASPTKNNHFCQFSNHVSLHHSTGIKQWLFVQKMSYRLGHTGEFISRRHEHKGMIFGMLTNKRMLYWPWVSVAIEIYFRVFPLKYQYLKYFLREHYLKSNLLQLSNNMFCKNIARLAVARERIHVWQPCDAP